MRLTYIHILRGNGAVTNSQRVQKMSCVVERKRAEKCMRIDNCIHSTTRKGTKDVLHCRKEKRAEKCTRIDNCVHSTTRKGTKDHKSCCKKTKKPTRYPGKRSSFQNRRSDNISFLLILALCCGCNKGCFFSNHSFCFELYN